MRQGKVLCVSSILKLPRTILLLFFALLLGLGNPTLAGNQGATKRYILEHASLPELCQAVQDHGGMTIRQMDTFHGIVAQLPSTALPALIKRFPHLRHCEDIRMKAAVDFNSQLRSDADAPPTDTPQVVPWGLNAINSGSADLLSAGKGITVCVVDTGIDPTHPDLQANIIGGKNFVAVKGAVNPSDYSDDNGHGSHVAGIIAALDNNIGTVGVAPDASIFAVKALNSTGSGYLSDIADGTNTCVSVGAKVINLSLGATSDPSLDTPLKRAISSAISAGIIVVASAGNEGQDISNTVPAGYPRIIAVSAIDSELHFPDWSNFGLGHDDFAAPGVGIYSTWKNGAYKTINGTSMASAHVAGVAALMLSNQKRELKAIDLGVDISKQGHGLIDATQTVNAQ